ncbi:SDR family oxidoreductase [Pendulispora albinea]|uniref:SDR family oxidoreductase n=1 Tax=Pendulispora albinea TaxID=2741071 RepID=A0ABZ2MBC9_9BACT
MSESHSLSGRIAVVTGASSGIGEATARKLAARGASVALLARRKDRLHALAADIQKGGGRALTVAVDVNDAKGLAEATHVIAGELGPVDLVVNNAGVVEAATFGAGRMADFEKMIDVNLKGAVRVADAFAAPLIAAAQKGGPADLVNISSVAAQGVYANFAVYCATKAAITHLSRNLRVELGPQKVRVSVIEPGLVETELQGHVTDDTANQWFESARKSFSWLASDDIAETIAFATALPRHVNIERLTVLPTQQV